MNIPRLAPSFGKTHTISAPITAHSHLENIVLAAYSSGQRLLKNARGLNFNDTQYFDARGANQLQYEINTDKVPKALQAKVDKKIARTVRYFRQFFNHHPETPVQIHYSSR